MKHLRRIYECLCVNATAKQDQIYNYTIPQSWNTFGYSKGKLLKSGELMVDPYDYSAFALANIIEQVKQPLPPLSKVKGRKGEWIKQQVVYVCDVRTLGSWDHDRCDCIEQHNLYDFNDQGTFLKGILLLPLLKRAGITTLILPNTLALAKPKEAHDYADFHAVSAFAPDSSFADPCLDGCSIEEQLGGFIEVAHGLGMRVIQGISPALMARDNEYVKEHPEWFYWIHKDQEASYAAPHVEGLPKNCTPSEKICPLLYQSESGIAHQSAFVNAPKAFQCNTLKEYESVLHITTAPMITDQVNADLLPRRDVTPLRFYEDTSRFSDHTIPCLLQDMVRMDLYPGKTIMRSLWDTLIKNYLAWIQKYDIDGFYLMDSYMVPKAFMKEMITVLRKQQTHLTFLVENVDPHHGETWKKIGFDAMSGNSAYDIYDVMGHQYHNFTYSLPQLALPIFAASEFLDTPRIVQRDGGETLAKLLSFMNLFLPNAIPAFMSGQLSLEPQPQYLSCFADAGFLTTLPRIDSRYCRQSFLDQYQYDYTRKDFHVFINQLECFAKHREPYIEALRDPKSCIPVWFDNPKDSGIGFTYVLEDKALLVVCNTNVHDEVDLRIHTENMLWELPFQWKTIHQIYASDDPYVHELRMDMFQTIPMHFTKGEVKIIEVKP